MTTISAKRSVMTLYSDANSVWSHRVRIVLAEKGVTVDVVELEARDHIEKISELNPYGELPILVDRDLVLYQSDIIMEYLDERFPHPPLMPVYPVLRARNRLARYRIEHDWYPLIDKILLDDKNADKARQELLDGLNSIMPAFTEMPFFLGEEFGLLDCTLAALLWRLPSLGIDWKRQSKAAKAYQKKIFSRDSFQASLTSVERDLETA